MTPRNHSLILTVLLVVAAAFLLIHIVTEKPRQNAAVQRAVALADSLAMVDRARTDSLHALEVRLIEAKSRVPNREVLVQKQLVVDSMYLSLPDSVLEQHAIIPAQRELIQEQAEAIEALEAVVETQDSVIALQTVMISDLRFSNATLQHAVEQLRNQRQERAFGVIPLPNRTTSLVLGIALGAVAVGSM
jgi:hypothetical protein